MVALDTSGLSAVCATLNNRGKLRKSEKGLEGGGECTSSYSIYSATWFLLYKLSRWRGLQSLGGSKPTLRCDCDCYDK